MSHTRTVTFGGRRLAFLHDVEVVIEGRDLVHLGLRELHRLRERIQVRGGKVPEAILDAMQVLDQVFASRGAPSSSARSPRARRDRGPALGDRTGALDLGNGMTTSAMFE